MVMLPWSHALLLVTLSALGGQLAVRWSQLDSPQSARTDHVLWLLGPILVLLVGVAGVSWARRRLLRYSPLARPGGQPGCSPCPP